MSDKPIIKYTDRDFQSIQDSLVEYTKRKYPNTFKDFSSGSPISWFINLVSYIGDQLSFNIDYSVNETFLDSAIEAKNIVRLGKQVGYKHNPARCSYGIATFYISVPADATSKPNTAYLPILKKGSEFGSKAGASFILLEDVNFSNPNNTVVVSEVNTTTGQPTKFAIKTYGQVVSGEIKQTTIDVGTYKKFLKLEVLDSNITEIISVVDSEGREYYEVENLSNDVIYKAIINRTTDNNISVKSVIKPFPAPRRFTFEYDNGKYFLQFGYGSDSSIDETTPLEPSNIVLQRLGKNYITDTNFDPSKLIENDKFGISPANTTLTIVYRRNTTANSNVSVGSLVNVSNSKFDFGNDSSLNTNIVKTVISSLEIDNEEAIVGDIYVASIEELKNKIVGNFSAQGRAVTKNDYETIVYNMPAIFGSVKRCSVQPSSESGERVINIYTVCEDFNGHLYQSNDPIKQNIKTWIGKHKMLNDSIQILDARIANFAIDFIAIAKNSEIKSVLYQQIYNELKELFSSHMYIGEPLNIMSIYSTINSVSGVADTTQVIVQELSGGIYSSNRIGLDDYKTSDGKLIIVPADVILELKYPNIDIRGLIK